MIATGAAVLAAWLSVGAPPEEAPPDSAAECRSDPASLELEAENLRAESSSDLPPEAIERLREILGRLRFRAPSTGHSLAAADLAEVSGDLEQAGDLLAEAAESNRALLSDSDLVILGLRAERAGHRREAIALYETLRLRDRPGSRVSWAVERIDQLQVEIEAEDITAPASSPQTEARMALADAKRALASGRSSEAREKLRLALRLSPSYLEALLALGALETREKHVPSAIRAYKEALAVEPENFDALVGMANLLWEEPDRRAKEQSLRLLDRAIALRPDAVPLLRLSATRWAEWGDAGRALERLDRFRAMATERDRVETEDLRRTLVRRVRGEPEETASSSSSSSSSSRAPAPASSPALDAWKKAQVLFLRGDPGSLDAALSLTAEAERLDARFGRAPELAAEIYEKRGDARAAEDAWRRAIDAEPSHAAAYERLATLVARDPRRAAEAEAIWANADEAGSPEAPFYLGEAAARRGERTRAIALLSRYRAESSSGVHSEQSALLLTRLEGQLAWMRRLAVGGLLLALVAAAVGIYRRIAGRTLEEWLTRDPEAAAASRSIVGRVRHEVLKHGGLLLSDAADRIESGDASAGRETATLLVATLYGAENEASRRPGLVGEAEAALGDLEGQARERGVRLNLRHRDPHFSRVAAGVTALRRAERDLRAIAQDSPDARDLRRHARLERRAARRLRQAVDVFRRVSGEALERMLSRFLDLPVRLEFFRDLLARVAAEQKIPCPRLELLGGSGEDLSFLCVRVPARDWETIWRNLFGNALAAGKAGGTAPVRLALAWEVRRERVTGHARLRLTLADNAPGDLTAAVIRERSSDRGLGLVADLVRRHDGVLEVGPPPADGFCKGIVLEFPAGEASP